MDEKKVWDKVLGDYRKCRWYMNGLCIHRVSHQPVSHINDFALCEKRICENYEETRIE